MTKQETIWSRARATLLLTGAPGEEDVLLWEHSARVAQSALAIAVFPEVAALTPDHLIVLVAALYHDAAWVIRFRDGECTRGEVLCRSLSPPQREVSLRHMEQSLSDVVAPALLDRAGRVIRNFADRETVIPEARILADAENLEEVGLASLWPSIRRGAGEGKGVQTMLDQWNRRKEYHFWTSRLKEGFHFAAVREIAVRRLSAYEQVMDQLRLQQACADFPTGSDISAVSEDRKLTAGSLN